MNALRVALCSLLLLITLPALAVAQAGTYTQVDFPGQSATHCQGINAMGDVVGYYLDLDGNEHGFLLQSGTYTAIDYPLANSTVLNGINDRGQIVGSRMGAPLPIGFVFDLKSQTFTDVIYPGANLTAALAVNNNGTVVGYFEDSGQAYGFELAASRYRKIALPSFEETYLYSIDALGDLIGDATLSPVRNLPFFFRAGKYERITLPSRVRDDAFVSGTNESGTALVGYYLNGPELAGFLDQNGRSRTIAFPGAKYTIASGVNDVEQIVGYFVGFDGGLHGFLWTPPAGARQQ